MTMDRASSTAPREWTIYVCPDGHVSTHAGPCIARDPETCDTYHRPPRPDTEPKKVVPRERTRVLEEALAEAAIPLEVIAGQNRVKPYVEMSPSLLDQIDVSVEAIRSSLAAVAVEDGGPAMDVADLSREEADTALDWWSRCAYATPQSLALVSRLRRFVAGTLAAEPPLDPEEEDRG